MDLVKAAIFAGVMALGSPEVPSVPEVPPVQQGPCEATCYGSDDDEQFYGDRTADGQKFRPLEEVTAAHKTLPLGTTIMIESLTTGRTIWARVTDRGPYTVRTADGETKPVGPSYDAADSEKWFRCLDLSVKAGRALGGFRIHQVRLRWWNVGPERVDTMAQIGP